MGAVDYAWTMNTCSARSSGSADKDACTGQRASDQAKAVGSGRSCLTTLLASSGWACLFGLVTQVMAQTPRHCPDRPDYQNLRYEENWLYLADPACAEGAFDRLKFLPLDESRERYASLGGEARLRYEFTNNGAFGADTADDNGYFLKRYLLHADLHAIEKARVFFQLQSANESGRVGGPRLEDEDDLDINQAFVDWTPWSQGENSFTLRVGRQELEFGASRLLSARDGLNTRQSFDGLRTFGRAGRWHYNATLTSIVNTVPGMFDNDSNLQNWYAGLSFWTAIGGIPGANITFLSPSRRQQNRSFDIGRGTDERYTHALRVWGRTGVLDYNWEGGMQHGEFEGRRVRAWYFASDSGYSLPDSAMAARLGLRLDITSGDRDPNDGELNTFSSLFASTSYSGLAGQIGPANALDVAPSLSLTPWPNLRLNAGVIGFWRVSRADGIYTTTGNLRRTGRLSEARHIGTQTTIQVVYTPSPHWTLLATLAYFETGRFLDETPPAEDVTYFTAWVTFRF